MSPPCANCGRQVRLKAASPAGPICLACHARRNTGTCGSCGRAAILVGRNPDGNPWCSRCYAAAAAAHLAEGRREIVLTAVTLFEPDLAADAVQGAIDAAGTRALPRLSAHSAPTPRHSSKDRTATPRRWAGSFRRWRQRAHSGLG